jgi:hypothetical protein
MSAGRARVRPQTLIVAFLTLFLCSVLIGTPVFSAEKTEQKTETKDASQKDAQPKESFNLIIPFKDLTVGQGQDVTMDTEVVNRTKNPVEVSLSLESVPKGWDVNFNSRYPSYPIRSVTVQGEIDDNRIQGEDTAWNKTGDLQR